jgi:hypothetical protein
VSVSFVPLKITTSAVIVVAVACSRDASSSSPGVAADGDGIANALIGARDVDDLDTSLTYYEPYSGELTNEELRGHFLVWEPTANQIRDRGRITGYQVAFSDDEAWRSSDGLAFVVSRIDVFEDAGTAIRMFDFWESDDRAYQNPRGTEFRFFEPQDLTEAVYGFEAANERTPVVVTTIRFRSGPYLGMVEIIDFTLDGDRRDDAAALARTLLDRLGATTE